MVIYYGDSWHRWQCKENQERQIFMRKCFSEFFILFISVVQAAKSVRYMAHSTGDFDTKLY